MNVLFKILTGSAPIIILIGVIANAVGLPFWLDVHLRLGWQAIYCGDAVTVMGAQYQEALAIEHCAARAFQNRQAFVAEICYGHFPGEAGFCRLWVGDAQGAVFFTYKPWNFLKSHPYAPLSVCPEPIVTPTAAGRAALTCPALPQPIDMKFFIHWMQ